MAPLVYAGGVFIGGHMPKDNEPKYFAVPDPDTGDMTYWERTKDGQYVAWPRKPRAAWYGPPMPSRKEQAQHEDIGAFGRHWWETIRKPWMDTVIAAIERLNPTLLRPAAK